MSSPFNLLAWVTYVQSRLDSDLRLQTLARRAGISPWHFHRAFKAAAGETLKQHTQRLRLERAAVEMLLHEETLLAIALRAGFHNHETFSRAFRRWNGNSPSEYRKTWQQPAATSWEDKMNADAGHNFEISETRFIKLRDTHVAYIRHVGPYEQVSEDLWRELTGWAGKRGFKPPYLQLGIAHDPPGITPPAKLRFDAAIALPCEFESGRRIGYQKVSAMDAVVTKHVGAYASLPDAYRQIVERVKRMHRLRLIGLPAIEYYHTSQAGKQFSINHTDIYLPVKHR